jgi:hypothetical protein
MTMSLFEMEEMDWHFLHWIVFLFIIFCFAKEVFVEGLLSGDLTMLAARGWCRDCQAVSRWRESYISGSVGEGGVILTREYHFPQQFDLRRIGT